MEIKVDKIFCSHFDNNSYDNSNISFKLDLFEDHDVENRITYQILIKRIDELLRKNEKFNYLIESNSNNKKISLNIFKINEIYSYLIENIKDYNKIEIFSAIVDYFDFNEVKFYNTLYNKYKEELLLELDKRLNILEKKKIKKLF